MNQGCVEAKTGSGEEWRCMLAKEVWPYVETPLFVMQSRYDAWEVRVNRDWSLLPLVITTMNHNMVW